MAGDERAPSNRISDDIAIVSVEDEDTLTRIAQALAQPRMRRWFWEDSMRVAPVTSFSLMFRNPANTTLLIGAAGDGVLSFTAVQDGWRGRMHAAIWGPSAARKPDLHRRAIAVVMAARRLYTIDAVVAADNRAVRAALRRAGFRRRGRFPKALCYNSVRVDGLWYEIDRAALDLPEDPEEVPA